MKCENPRCNKEHDGSFGSGRFCSRSCANSRYFSKESKKKKSLANKNFFINLTLEEKAELLRKRSKKYSNKNIKKLSNKEKDERKIKRIKETPFEQLSEWDIKIKISLEEKKCSKCGLSEWNNVKLPLELHHKDGNRNNNSRDNLELLCPNCHSITDNWRGRNKNNTGKKKISDNDLLKAVKNTPTIRQALLSVGLAAKGNNYLRVKKLIEEGL